MSAPADRPRRTVTAIAAEDLARMLERDGMRCAARLLRASYVGADHGALTADAMTDILADIAVSRPRGNDARDSYAHAARAIREGAGYTALGVLAALCGDDTATTYAARCATEQGVEVSP